MARRRRSPIRRWLGPWTLMVLDAETCQWERPFEHVNIPSRAAAYICRGPMVPNPNGQRWGHPRTGRWMP